MQKNNPRSLAMLLSAMLIYGSIGLFRRLIPLPSGLLACFRGLCGALVLFVFCRLMGRKIARPENPRAFFLLILSGAVMGFNWILLFEAYNYTSVPVATLCYYMAPVFVLLLSPILFGEKMTLRRGICVLLSLTGIVLVSGVASGQRPAPSELRGIFLGLGAAALYATVVILNKKLPGLEPYGKTVIQLLAAALALVPYLMMTGQKPVPLTPFQGLALLSVGIVHTGLAYALYFGSMDGLRAQTVALCSYLDPVTALFLSALLLGEQLTLSALVGAVLIIGAAVVSETEKDREA